MLSELLLLLLLLLLALTVSRCRRTYIVPLLFFFFFRRLYYLRSLNGSQLSLNTYSLTTAIWNIWSELPGHGAFSPPPTGWGQKNRFWGWLWTSTEHILATEHDINNRKKLSIYRESPTCPEIGWTLSRNGWEQPIPHNFSIARQRQPYRMDVVQQTAGKHWHVLCSGTSLQSRTTSWALPCVYLLF